MMGLTGNVVDGALIASAWGNEIRDRTLQVFQTVVERNAGWANPPDGAHCVTLDTYTMWQRRGGTWVGSPVYADAGAVQSGDKNLPGGGVLDLASLSLAAWPVASKIVCVWALAAGFGTGLVTVTPSTTVWTSAQNTLSGKPYDAPNGKWVYSTLTQAIAVPATVAPVIVGTVTLSGAGYANGGLSYTRIVTTPGTMLDDEATR